MRRVSSFLLAILFTYTTAVFAQGPGSPQNGSIGGNTISVFTVNAGSGTTAAGGTITVAGTFSGTVNFESSVDGVTWAALTAYPIAGGVGASTTTTIGSWSFSNVGYAINGIRLRGSSWVSGTATLVVTTNSSTSYVSGAGIVTGPLLLPDGSTAAPSLSFASHPTTGFYLQGGLDRIGIMLGGTAAALMLPNRFTLSSQTQTIELGSGNDVILRRSGTKALSIDADGAGGALNSISLSGPVVTKGQSANNIALDASGVNYGQIQNVASASWALGYGTSVSSLGTAVLTWSSAGALLNTGNLGFGAFDASHAAWKPSGTTILARLGDDSGDASISGGAYTVASAGYFQWGSRNILKSPADGQLNILNQAQTAGVGFDVATDGTLKIRNRAQNADAALTAGAITASTALVVGTNSASTGAVRLANGGTIFARDPGNTTDYLLLSTTTFTTGSVWGINIGNGNGSIALRAGVGKMVIIGDDNTNAYPALKRSGTTVAFRLADDSADAALSAGAITASGGYTGTGVANNIGGAVQAVADGTAISIGANPLGLFFIVDDGDNTVAQVITRAGSAAVTIVSDPTSIFSTAAGTANKVNVYWSAGNSRYELENKRGASRNFHIVSVLSF